MESLISTSEVVSVIRHVAKAQPRFGTTVSSSSLLPLRLLGSMALSNHYRSEDLLDVDTAAGGFQQRQGLKYCLPLTFCIHTGLSQYIAVEAAEGRNKNEVFYQCPVSRSVFECGIWVH